MIRVRTVALALVVFAAGPARPASAQEQLSDPPSSESRGLYALGLGWFDLVHGKNEALDMRVEYRAATTVWRLQPWAGLEATTDQAVYLLAGLRYEWDLHRRLIVTLSSGGGLYADGDGKRLNFPLEFRSQIEAALRVTRRCRLGLAFGHISNASLARPNPGAEVLVLYFSVEGSR